MSKIIYVQQNEDIAKAFQELFLENGIEMLIAKTGEEALAIVKQEKVLLLLIDINIPDMRLRKFVDRIREISPQVILNVCIDVLDPLMITKLSNRHHIHKIYAAPWDVEEIIEEVKESIEVALINEQTNIREEQVNSEKEELENTIESLKSTLKKQQYSYKKLSSLIRCFTDAFSGDEEVSWEKSRRIEFAEDVYKTLLRMQTTGAFDIDKFEEGIKRDLIEIKGKALGYHTGEISSCLFGGQSRAKAQNIRFCIYLIARLYAQFCDTFELNVSSHYITTKEAEFCISLTLPSNTISVSSEDANGYFEFVDSIISDMTNEFRTDEHDKTIEYYLVFPVVRET